MLFHPQDAAHVCQDLFSGWTLGNARCTDTDLAVIRATSPMPSKHAHINNQFLCCMQTKVMRMTTSNGKTPEGWLAWQEVPCLWNGKRWGRSCWPMGMSNTSCSTKSSSNSRSGVGCHAGSSLDPVVHVDLTIIIVFDLRFVIVWGARVNVRPCLRWSWDSNGDRFHAYIYILVGVLLLWSWCTAMEHEHKDARIRHVESSAFSVSF